MSDQLSRPGVASIELVREVADEITAKVAAHFGRLFTPTQTALWADALAYALEDESEEQRLEPQDLIVGERMYRAKGRCVRGEEPGEFYFSGEWTGTPTAADIVTCAYAAAWQREREEAMARFHRVHPLDAER